VTRVTDEALETQIRLDPLAVGLSSLVVNAGSAGLDSAAVRALVVDSGGRRLYAGIGRGVVDYRFPQ
jgi:hypothetical protein